MRRALHQVRQAAPVVPEHSLARQIADVLTLELAPPGRLSRHGVVWYAIDHAAYAGVAPGARVGRGIIAGIPDLFVLCGGLAGFIEIKTGAGVLSQSQRAVIAAVLGAGGRVGVARDAATTLACLDGWRIPRCGITRL
jgi:hypothetical protein